jgi:hypothetical protein
LKRLNKTLLHSQSTGLKHVVVSNHSLTGFEYGVLRDFEDEILRITGGRKAILPERNLPTPLLSRIARGTRYEGLRSFIPKAHYDLQADVLWYVLMSPNNYSLDLYKGWDQQVGIKVLYLFDTFEFLSPLICQIVADADWDLLITSFHGAIPFLEEVTQKKWYAVPQGVKLDRFLPVADSERIIPFSSYGRRHSKIHASLRKHCADRQKYYDYSMTTALSPHIEPQEAYTQYAWHLLHSVFAFCWSVESTSPGRATTFSPITCRWFEAAASGTVMLGKPPNDPVFDQLLGADLVIPIDWQSSFDELDAVWDLVWEKRQDYLRAASERRSALSHQWTWESRVFEILDLIHAG